MKSLALIATALFLQGMAASAHGSSLPAGVSSDEWVRTLEYKTQSDDAGAFFFRFELQNTRCIEARLRLTFSPNATSPWILSKAIGSTETIRAPDGTTMKLDDPSAWSGWIERGDGNGDSHVLVNLSAGDVVIHRSENTTGYDSTTQTLSLGSETTSCTNDFSPTERWMAIISTARTSYPELSFAFYEDFRIEDGRFVLLPGAAKGRVVLGAESSTTFLSQLKDFDGTFGYDGDPLGATPGRNNAAGVNLQRSVQTARGFAGGFLDIGWNHEASVLSYLGPNGEAGAGTDVTPATPIPKSAISHIAGGPGEWNFRANAYAAPGARSSLFLWGADIETEYPT